MAAATISLSKLGVYFMVLYFLRTSLSQNVTVTNSTVNNTNQTTQTTTPATTTTPAPTTTTLSPNVPGTTLPSDTDFSRCPCDLTGLACDVNCCCDPDCSTNDRQVFSECLRNSYRLDDKLCFDRDVILYENGPQYSNTTDNLFCIYFDNDEERNYYINPSIVTTEAEIQDYIKDYGKFSFQSLPISYPPAQFANFYKSGDPMYVVFQSQAVSYLALPTALSTSPACADGNPAAYLMDQSLSCVRAVTNLDTECTNALAFQASPFYQGMRLVQDPFLLQAFNSSSTVTDPVLGTVDLSGVTELYNNNYTLDFVLDPDSPLRCVSVTGVESTCTFNTPPAAPSWNAASLTCQNVLTKVEYRFVTEGTFGIQNAFVNFVFSDITSTSLTQTFQSTFAVKSDASAVVQRSGNPGYQIGQPIMAGILEETTTPTGSKEQVIQNRKVRGQQLTLVRPTVAGSCSSGSSLREPVVFGENMRSGCFIQVSLTNNVCQDLQEEIIRVLEDYAVPAYTDGSYPKNYRYVAMFGNSNVTVTGDWLEILYQNRPSPQATSDECFLSLGMDIKVVYANVGALANPQPKIIGVSFVYDTTQKVVYRCSGPFCQAGASTLTQRVEISQSVTFIDASDSPQGVESEYPTFAVRLPYDFFYPFLNAGSLQDSGCTCLVLCLLLLFGCHM